MSSGTCIFDDGSSMRWETVENIIVKEGGLIVLDAKGNLEVHELEAVLACISLDIFVKNEACEDILGSLSVSNAIVAVVESDELALLGFQLVDTDACNELYELCAIVQ